MIRIDTVFMLVTKKRGKLGILYHRPGKTAREAWDYGINEWWKDFAPSTDKSDVEKDLRSRGYVAKRVEVWFNG